MKSVKQNFIIVFVSVLLSGCVTSDQTRNSSEVLNDSSAMKAVAESITGKQLDEKQLRKINQDLQKDPDAREAVKIITDSVQGKKPVAKYSPVTGKRYAPNMEYDPETGVKLLPVE